MGAGLGWRNELRLEYAKIDVPVAHVGEWWILAGEHQKGAEPERPMLRQHPIAALGMGCDDGVRQTLLLILRILDLFLQVFYLENPPVCFWGM